MLLETFITFPVLKSETISSKTLSFLVQSFQINLEQFTTFQNNLDPTLWNPKRFVDFKSSILKFVRPSPSNVFNYNNHKGIRLITRLRVGMSHLREHKFKDNFQDCLNPICSCGLDIESTSHFLLHCTTFDDEQYTLLSTLNNIDCTQLELTKSSLSQTLLYGNTLFDKEKNMHS